MTEIPLKPPKGPKYPQNSKVPLTPKKNQNTAKNSKLNKIAPEPLKRKKEKKR